MSQAGGGMAVATIVAEELREAEHGRWDEFVRSSPHALPHHLLGWRAVIRDTYGFRPRYLVAKRGRDVAGVMPLFEVRSLLEGRHFTTLPGGICADSEEAGQALVERAIALTRAHDAGFLAIRDSRRAWEGDFVTHRSQCHVVAEVAGDVETTLRGLPRDVRQCIRRAQKSGLALRVGADQIDDFWAVFSAFARRHGTPVFPKRLLTNLARQFPGEAVLIGEWLGDRIVGGALKFILGRTSFGMLLFARDEYIKLEPNHLMYWESLEYAATHGLGAVDFGRSKAGSGQHRFKLRWGKREVPIYQLFFLHRARRAPMVADDADEGYGRLMVRAWRRLPLPATRLLGPLVRRQVPFV